jgi:DNA-binding NarL/FixJ family response regulator
LCRIQYKVKLKQYKILIADNQPLYIEGIKAILTGKTAYNVVDSAADSGELIYKVLEIKPDIVILDYAISGCFCLEDIQGVHTTSPGTKILIVSTSQQKKDILEALRLGINNYILKLCDTEEFVSALDATAKNERFFCGKVIDAILDKHVPKTESCEGVALSPREIEIVKLISRGLSNQAIADSLFLSVHTVGTHRKNILRKLGLNKSCELIMYAVKQGIVCTDLM